MTDQRAILIAGPTASGKSGLALALARSLGGVVINADSMQVYGDLRVLTARPSPEDEALAAHRLYGFVDGGDAYSAGRFAVDAGAEIQAARQAGKCPIIVGGTGLYFQALLVGLSPIPAIPEEIREKWRAIGAREGGPRDLYRLLAERDARMAERLQPGDRQRVTRALEVIEATGRSLADWQEVPPVPVLKAEDTVRLWLDVPRGRLAERIRVRLEAMVEMGAIEEVERLLLRGLQPDLPVMRAVGVAEFAQYVGGEAPLARAVELAETATRQYVKRQVTWARRNMISWNAINMELMERIVDGDVTLIEILNSGV